MNNLQNRHDLTDSQWERIDPIIKKRLGNWDGSNAGDNRVFVNACFWIVRTGALWRDLLEQYGKYNAVRRHYKISKPKMFFRTGVTRQIKLLILRFQQA